jgi:hypothetical protein
MERRGEEKEGKAARLVLNRKRILGRKTAGSGRPAGRCCWTGNLEWLGSEVKGEREAAEPNGSTDATPSVSYF